jgi:hypothetical protein
MGTNALTIPLQLENESMTQIQRQAWTDRLAIVIPIMLFILGIAIASEHRITSVENANAELQKQTQIMYDNQKTIMQTQARVVTILDMIVKEREIEIGKRK